MSKKLFESFDHLLAGDHEAAQRAFHEHVIAQSKEIYRQLSEADEFALDDEEAPELSHDGDMDDDFVSDIESNEDDIATDELNDGDLEVDADADIDMDQDSQIEDIRAKIDELLTSFNALVDAESQEPEHAEDDFERVEGFEDEDTDVEDMEDDTDELDFDDEEDEDEDMEHVKESVKTVSMEKPTEGKFVGTGKNSKSGSVNAKSLLSSNVTKSIGGAGKAVDFAKGQAEKGGKGASPKAVSVSNEPKVKTVADAAEKGEGGYVGTGKNTPGAKVVNKNSILTKKVKDQ